MIELKSCPFCGFSAFIEETDLEWKDQFPYRILCGNEDCAGSHSWASTEEEAITAWNTRADGWISVEDRLPKLPTRTYDWFLVVVSDGLESDITIATYSTETSWSRTNITHWRPLPKPPDTGKE